MRRVVIDAYGDMNDEKIGHIQGRMWMRYKDLAHGIKYRNYEILATDYETFAIIYNCRPSYTVSMKKRFMHNVWVLSRKPLEVNFE